MSNKIYKKLPVVLQTTALKNFFESTVEQLFSKANVEQVSGFIGYKTTNDLGVSGYLKQETPARIQYALSPVVNTVNQTTNEPENFIFFDELIDTLNTYGVDTRNQNKIFGANYYSYMPPIDVDKFVNYQEYYWYPQGPSTISIAATLDAPIDIDRDVLGKSSFTYSNVTLRNGMIVQFSGDYVIPSTKVSVEYIVQGVGESIFFVTKKDNFASKFSTPTENPYDGTVYSLTDDNVSYSAANVSSVVIVNEGIGYVNPTVVFTGSSVNASATTANITVEADGSISDISVTAAGARFSGQVGVELVDIDITHNINVSAYTGTVQTTDRIYLDSNVNVKVGQSISGLITGIVKEVGVGSNYITLIDNVTFDLSDATATPELSFAGRNFNAEVRLSEAHTITSGNVQILDSQVRPGVNPVTEEHYLDDANAVYAFDRNKLESEGVDSNLNEGDIPWDSGVSQSTIDYILLARGAANKNIWSRINFWYHRDNFLDAGDELPSREFRANRPIIEFDKDLELYNHGVKGIGAVSCASTLLSYDDLNGLPSGTLVDGVPSEDATIIFPSETLNVAKYIYTATTVGTTISLSRVGHPTLNPSGAVDGDYNFVPWEVEVGDVVQIAGGATNIGKEYAFTEQGFVLCQEKFTANQPPLFTLYDINGTRLDDSGVYPNNNFTGNKIFSYAESTTSTIGDTELGFPLTWKSFKAASEILFENNIYNYILQYTPFGSSVTINDPGYKFYKLTKDTPEYFSYFKPSSGPAKQRIKTVYEIDQFDVDAKLQDFYIGCIPNINQTKASGFDIDVIVNGIKYVDFQYGTVRDGYIRLDAFTLSSGDLIEINAISDTGLLEDNTISNFELPISWKNNTRSENIPVIAEPEYIPHFKNYMERQDGFSGDVLGSNNFASSPKNIDFAKDIVLTDQSTILAAMLLDDQPYNLIEAIRFNASEYDKFKARLKSEITKYFSIYDISSLSNEYVLEKVLRNVISYSVGNNVFNRTYVVPFGDNYEEETFVINDLTTSEFALTIYSDLNKIENSLLVYQVKGVSTRLLSVDADYSITSFNPITIELSSDVDVELDDRFVFKLYNSERDSAQCPPTPSVLGLYPLFQPRIELDTSFQTPVQVLVGHDGSRTTTFGDRRDEVLLEFEKRIYNGSKAEFRSANALPELNINTIKPGIFRNTGYSINEWSSFLRQYFSNWTIANKVDPVTNEFFDEENEWTWNYRGDTTTPGHWRGWYEYYYDTVRPHTHPWEMLAFFEKPTWWDSEYGTDYSSNNTAMWDDLNEGIIRHGNRENVSNNLYLTNNPYRREGLHLIVPVDSEGNLKTPKEIISTGVSTKVDDYTNANANISAGYAVTSYLNVDGVNVSFDGSIGSGNIYVQSRGLVNHPITIVTTDVGHNELDVQDASWNIPRINLNSVGSSPTTMPDYAVGVAVNGLPLYNITTVDTWNDEGEWHYNKMSIEGHSPLGYGHADANGLLHYYNVEPILLGLEEWDSSEHSPIVGWAFDGLPIYGPYGYKEYDGSGNPINSNEIVNIKSPWILRQGSRTSGPGGAYTGVFVEDYMIDSSKNGQPGYTNQYNLRYGKTPDSPSTPIWFYVSTLSDSGEPMFPYTLGGGYKTHTGSTRVWAGKYYAAGHQLATNTLSNGPVNSSATPALTSTFVTTYTTTSANSNSWKFGDGAPVENAWKYTEIYPFAVIEALLLAKPGKFAVEFADPTKLFRPNVNRKYKLSNATNQPWKFYEYTDFAVHGELDFAGDFVTNIGYTQFIYTWLRFQNLDIADNFSIKMRSLNTRLGHRMAGFIDKDTMVLRTDQYSSTGNASSQIIPKENIHVKIHNSPYKTRNFYTGVVIEKTSSGYKIRGYDKNLGYFNTLASDTNGPRERISVGGSPAPYVDFTIGGNYKTGTIVRYRGTYYSAKENLQGVASFVIDQWTRIGVLPQIGGASGTLYQKSLNTVVRVDYETVFETDQEVFDFLIGLGRYQEKQGYGFGEYDTTIADVRNWAYAAKQFLFWVTGNWEIGNTLELSPLAGKVIFDAPRGFIAKINRNDRNQFTIIDQNGVAIDPSECEIVREDTKIEIAPPEGKQIYGVVLFTKEIEHAIVVDNVTNFNDTIYDDIFNQGHTRFKIKATKTADWDGRLISQGFIITDDELKLNLDNMAESLGRIYDIGFVPVEKGLYSLSRGNFGFTDQAYLSELDITDDQQFEFYKGLIQSKGTKSSLEKITRSEAVIQGNVTIYDEWALRVGDFGDVDNEQSIELKIEKSEIVNDPQLVTLAFPEDTTNIVEKIEVLERKHKYFNAPQIIVSAPESLTGVRATATATLKTNGELDTITVNNVGSGYSDFVGVKVIAGEIATDIVDTRFNNVVAQSSGSWISGTGLANTISHINITDHIANVTANINLTSANTINDIVELINDTANIDITATAYRTESVVGNTTVDVYTLELSGDDFTINSADADLYLTTGYRYQPRQRYAIQAANNTVEANIVVKVDGTSVSNVYWDYDAGDRWKIQNFAIVDENASYTAALNTGLLNSSTVFANENYSVLDNNNCPFIDVYVNGTLITNLPDQKYGNNVPSVVSINSNSTVHFSNISLLPRSVLTPVADPSTGRTRFVLGAQSNIYIVEKPTVDFTDAYQGDLVGNKLNITVLTNDSIAIKLGRKRIYEITPDLQNDDIILIDIDDTARFLKKPSGVRENNLWPTTSLVDYNGLTDPKFIKMPNAGYVDPSNVNFLAYDVASLPDLFADNVIIKPNGGHLIHMAEGENKDWNVYKLKGINSNVSFVTTELNNAVLYTDTSLFTYLDSNMIGEADTNRYMDYVLTLKNANLSDNVVVWTNESIVQRKQAQIRDVKAPRMVEARIQSIKPNPNSVLSISNITPVTTSISKSATASATDENGIVTISNVNLRGLSNGDAVQLVAGETTSYTFNADVVYNSVGNVTFANANVDFVTAPGFVTLLTSQQVEQELGNANLSYVDLSTVNVTIDAADIDYVTTNVYLYADQLSNVTFRSNLTPLANTVVTIDSANVDYLSSNSQVILYSSLDRYLNGNVFTVSAVNVSAKTFTIDFAGTDYESHYDEANIVGNLGLQYYETGPVNTGPATISGTRFTVTDVNTGTNTFTMVGSYFTDAESVSSLTNVSIFVNVTEGDQSANGKVLFVENVNVSANTFTVSDSYFANANIVADLGNVRYTVETFTDYGSTDSYQIVSNVGVNSFTIELANIAGGIVDVRHMNKSKLSFSSNHGVTAGEVIKVFANVWTGIYTVDSVPESNTIIISSPYTYDANTTGIALKKGMQIVTTDPHGIDPTYAENKKRIALHFADPRSYNKVYYIDSITPDAINIDNRFTETPNAVVYFDRVDSWASNANVSSRTIELTEYPGLGSSYVFYTGNLQVVQPGQYTINPTNVVIASTSLDTDANVYTAFTIVREQTKLDYRYPVLTTVDHDKVSINNSLITINSFNNIDGVVASINRATANKRSAVSVNRTGALNVGFNMLTRPDVQVNVPQTNVSAKPSLIGNYGPYVRDEGSLQQLLSDQKQILGSRQISDVKEYNNDPTFNKGPIYVGPIKGITYTSTEEPYVDVVMKWDFSLRKYVPNYLQLTKRKTFLNTIISNSTAAVANNIANGTEISNGELYNDDVFDSSSDKPQETSLPISEPTGHNASYGILTKIAGSAESNPSPTTSMGKKWLSYDMTETVDLGSPLKTYWRWRLKSNDSGVYEVYEAVENNVNTVYYILVDRVYPTTNPHNYYGTVSAYNDFRTLPDDSVENLILEEAYYYSNTSYTGTRRDKATTTPAAYFDIPPVEPAFFVGKQIIPEPFAVEGGNGTDKLANFRQISDVYIGNVGSGKETHVLSPLSGQNSFFMWQPGLVAGEWGPTKSKLPVLRGRFNTGVSWGYGRGYYEQDDTHVPDSLIGGSSDPYPVVSNDGWITRQPRFKYGREFSVNPLYGGDVEYQFTNDDDLTDLTDTKIRPEEIFIACFWTEPYTYVNQITGYDYASVDSDGNPAPVYSDYAGTIVRVKYIRITELPWNAVLRRPIADTGWAGKPWKNIVTDDIDLPGEFSPVVGGADSPWSLFDPTYVAGGSTGDEDEPIVQFTNAVANSPIPPGVGQGFGRENNPTPYEAVVISSPDNKNTGTVIHGGVLEGLPSACQAGPNPLPPPDRVTGPCTTRPSAERSILITEKANTVSQVGNVIHEDHFIQVLGDHPVTVFFDFSSPGTLVNGVTIEQSHDQDFGNTNNIKFILDTRIDSGSLLNDRNGKQIGAYGSDYIPGKNNVILEDVNRAFGIKSLDTVYANQAKADITNKSKAVSRKTHEVGVHGFGFISRNVNCALGQHVRITVSKGVGSTSGRYNLYILYHGVPVAGPGVVGGDAETQPCVDSASKDYIQGAIFRQWTYRKNPIFSSKDDDGYFGVWNSKVSGSESSSSDNIYFPYHPLSQTGRTGARANAYAGGSNVRLVTESRIKTFSDITIPEETTMEIKGYIYAPKSGTYQFTMESDDASWLWVSDKDDQSGEEKYKNDGYNASDPKNYNWGNAVVKNGGRHPRATASGSVYLKGGKYYWLRAIFGNAEGPGVCSIKMTPPGGSSQGLSFSGRACDPCTGLTVTTTTGPGGLYEDYTHLINEIPLIPIGYANLIRGYWTPYSSNTTSQAANVACANNTDTPTFSPATQGNTDTSYNQGVTSGSSGSAGTGINQGFNLDLTNPNIGIIFPPIVPVTPDVLNGQLSGGLERFGYSTFAANFSGFSRSNMTGTAAMPSSFKRKDKKKVIVPQRYGYSVSLDNARFVNATSQRISGGKVVPLTNTTTPVSRNVTPLKSYDIANEPWYSSEGLSNLNKTLRDVNYKPRRIGSTVNINGNQVNNITGTASGSPATTINQGLNNSLTVVGPNVGTGISNILPETTGLNNLGPAVEVPFEEQQFDNENIRYARIPTINITPMLYAPDGSLITAGPPAVTNIYKPTPTIAIDENDLRTVPNGTEVFFNNKKVLFTSGTTAREISAQIRCGESGIDSQVYTDPVTGVKQVVLTSCDDNGFAVRNGCGGGTLRRVGDFHVVRGFEQTTTITESNICMSNTTVLPPTSGYGGYATAQEWNDRTLEVVSQTPEANYTLYSCDGSVIEVDPETVVTDIETGKILSGRQTGTTTSSSYMNGGSGYSVGDRLRLVGGTPVNNTRGPLTSLCINFPGAGYNNPANIRISIGGDNSPGVGAAAEVTSIDPNTGAITGYRMLNYGVGYDLKNPPSVTITDVSQRSNGWSTIDSDEPDDTITYDAGDILEVQTAVINGDEITSSSNWYRVVGSNVVLGTIHTYSASNVSFAARSDNQNSVIITSNSSVAFNYIVPNKVVTMLCDGDETANNRAYFVESVNKATGTFTIKDFYFENANVVNNLGNVEFSVREPFATALTAGVVTPICDQRLPIIPAEITGRIGIEDRDESGQMLETARINENFKAMAGPLRVAKFIVTGVDAVGAITSLRIIDRGLYAQFPADLTQGIPLEYDYEFVGSPGGGAPNSNNFGVADPSRNNIPYGPGHPDYADNNIFTRERHSKYAAYNEYRFNPTSKTWVPYNGSPGGYDPLTYVEIDGVKLSKQYDVELNPLSPDYGGYKRPLVVGGGTGARVFLTAEEVPDCSEKGRAKETLGLPDYVTEVDTPSTISRAINNALQGAGYRPEDIRAEVLPLGPGVGRLNLVSKYPSINIDSNTPGFLEKLGIDTGDYNAGILCLEATLTQPDLTPTEFERQITNLYNKDEFGILSPEQIAKNLPKGTGDLLPITPPTVLSLLCVDNIKSDPNSVLYNNLNGANFGDGSNKNVSFIKELYRYDVETLFGDNVTLSGKSQQNVNVYVLESQRLANNEQYNFAVTTKDSELGTQDTFANVWIDSYVNEDPANISMPGFTNGGWAYIENGMPKRWQTPLVDPEFIQNALIYNETTGNKEVDLEFWDPFKGIIPGFIENEIHFINDVDPVNYNNARTNFGQNNIGKVWWDTSTIKYMWYEQGTARDRWQNWGRAFPGSSITICEWVESKALPENWTGNGTPRWRDRYVTERRLDPETNQYTMYYYYWVQNRTKLDDRVKRSLGRKFDSQTVARYLANPTGYGLNMISYVSDNSFVLSNIGQVLKEDENIIQINLSRNLNPDGIKHTAWKLMREGDNNSIVPDHLSDKLIDSLSGENAIGQSVPDPLLSEVERYGIAFRPRQTMFKNIKDARRVMFSVLNNIFADIKLYTNYSGWDDNLPASLTYIKRVSWYEVDRVDTFDNTPIRYDSSYKPVFNVASVAELYTLNNLPDGTVVQVKASSTDRAQLWKYVAPIKDFKLIAIANETIQLSELIYTDDTNATMSNEIRLLLTALKDVVFANDAHWNTFFFELLKHAYMEQKQLSWAFKTSYLYIEKEEEDLIKINGFKPDNFDKVIEYINEVKPYTAKIREYKDGKKVPIEVIGPTMVSDFDKPPYVDRLNGSIRILDDYNEIDATIMFNDPAYQNYFSITNKAESPFRHVNTKLVFDRTNWQLTKFGFNSNTTTISESISENLAVLNSMSNAEVSSNTTIRNADRIFKFDPVVRAAFAAEINAHFSNSTASANSNIITNSAILYSVIEAGNLNTTLNLVKEKVGGGWRGETLDANIFTSYVEGLDATTDYITSFGWDTDPWDAYGFDRNIEVINYEGVFTGNVTLRRNDDTYEGFDGATFKKILYGEERPEELVLLDPLESLIIDVYTNPYPVGNSNTTIANTIVAPGAEAVRYQMHMNLFGQTEFLRILDQNTTTLTSNVFTYSTDITVANGSILQTPRPGDPGIIWIGTEKVLYNRITGNTISQLIRGASGTTVQDHIVTDVNGNPVVIDVWAGDAEQTFDRLDAEKAVWLEIGSEFYTYESYNVSSVSYSNVVYADSANIATVGANQLTLTTSANAASLLYPGGTVAIAANSTLLTAQGTSLDPTFSYTSNVTFFYVTNVDYANSIVTVADDLFIQDGIWDYGVFDPYDSTAVLTPAYSGYGTLYSWTGTSSYDKEVAEITYSNVTLEIPTLNLGANTALSLTDVANADYANTESLMKFIHNV